MMPQTLEDGVLYLFFFGPGFGESTIIRIPPSHWIVIDSCRIAHRSAALHVLEKFDGVASCTILTHPHRDHYRGFSEVLDSVDWAVVGCCDLRLEDEDVDTFVDPESRRGNELEQILAGITDYWRRKEGAKWWTWRSSHRQVGEARLTSLHPPEQFARENSPTNSNSLSSAMLLEWCQVRILLGADVENPHWEQITKEFAALNVHVAMKTPHHASQGALHTSVLSGDDKRLWLVTPNNHGGTLPRFEEGHGPELMLRHVSELYLTGLPVAHDCQNDCPCSATRRQLQSGAFPRPSPFELPGGLVGDTLPDHDDLSCYLIARFDEAGNGRVDVCGPGTVRVSE